ncbi:MAG TPA: DNA ligase D [Thermoanaerobaculia bacterium]|nr:DNA ligase D [Thermoanaerobaculia bacterium]
MARGKKRQDATPSGGGRRAGGAAAGVGAAGGAGAPAAGSAPELRRLLTRLGAPRLAVNVAEVVPMQAETRERPFSGPGWWFELKYDGFRMLAGKDAGRVRLLYRSGRDATQLFPELVAAVTELPFPDLVVDGEVVVLDAAFRPSFGLLQQRALRQPGADTSRAAAAAPATLFTFDLLACAGFDLRPLPLAARKSALRQVLATGEGGGTLRYVDELPERGEELFAAVAGLGLEGIMAKRADSPYQAGRSADWQKIRVDRSGDFAVVGFVMAASGDLRALQMAVHTPGGLLYAGSVGSGWNGATRAAIAARLASARRRQPAALGLRGDTARADRSTVWVAPELVCEVRYKEWTEGGSLRQPIFLRLRDDKRAQDCRHPEDLDAAAPEEEREPTPGSVPQVESGASAPPAVRKSAAGRRRAGRAAEPGGAAGGVPAGRGTVGGESPGRAAVRGGGSGGRGGREGQAPAVPGSNATGELPIELVRPGKVFWPDEGYTKGDLARYYYAVSPWLLAYLRDRPLVLDRYPDGIAGKSFFQKSAETLHAASRAGLRSVRLQGEAGERTIDAFLGDSVESLLTLVNLGAIPLHIWSSRFAALERPDWCILDLDPKGAPFADVIHIAREIHELCEEIGLTAFIKTSGGSGLHVLLPLGGQFDHEQSRQLAELLARLVVARLPRIATTVRAIPARGGRVYVDALQNGRGKLLAAPFSVRPFPGAPVSTPLTWREVGARLDVRAFTLATVPARLRRLREDPLAPVLTTVPDLAQVIERLGERFS